MVKKSLKRSFNLCNSLPGQNKTKKTDATTILKGRQLLSSAKKQRNKYYWKWLKQRSWVKLFFVFLCNSVILTSGGRVVNIRSCDELIMMHKTVLKPSFGRTAYSIELLLRCFHKTFGCEAGIDEWHSHSFKKIKIKIGKWLFWVTRVVTAQIERVFSDGVTSTQTLACLLTKAEPLRKQG